MGNFPKTAWGKAKKETNIQLPQTREKEDLGVEKDVQHVHQHLCFLLSHAAAKQQAVRKKRICIYNRIVWEQINGQSIFKIIL